jgi:transcriptional regulator with XRE-family HTH domain
MIAKPIAGSGRLRRARAQLEELLPTPALRDTYEEASASFEAGRLVRAMREMAGLTQQDLADRLAIKQPRISAIEAGRGRDGLTYALLKRIVVACGGRWGLPELLLGAMTEQQAKAVEMEAAVAPATEAADEAEAAEEAEDTSPRPFRY